MKFSYMAGVVGADDRSRFERQLFRTTRGNCYVRFAEIEQPISDPATGEQVMKLVFIVFYKVRPALGAFVVRLHAVGSSLAPLTSSVPTLALVVFSNPSLCFTSPRVCRGAFLLRCIIDQWRGPVGLRTPLPASAVITTNADAAITATTFSLFFRFRLRIDQAAAIEAKIKKICEAFRAKRYDLPEMDDGEGVKKLMYDNYGEMHDARVVLLKVYSVAGRVVVAIPVGCRAPVWYCGVA